MDNGYLFAVIAIIFVTTFVSRALPFAAGSWLQRQGWVRSLGAFLPLSVMVLLVSDACWNEMVARGASFPLYELAGVAVAFGLQWAFRSALVSIFSGMGLYVALCAGILPV